MGYNDLLVHLDDSKGCAKRVDAAVRLATRHGAHLTGFYPIVEIPLLHYIKEQIPRDPGEHRDRGEGARRCRTRRLSQSCGRQRRRL